MVHDMYHLLDAALTVGLRKDLTTRHTNSMLPNTLSGGPGVPICEGLSLPLATSMALILAATAAAASRAPVGAASASPIPPEPGPGWSHLLRRLGGQKNKIMIVENNKEEK